MYKVIKYSCSVRIENRVDEYDGDGYVYWFRCVIGFR